jgi:pimeloyl-ACP methyl ester carboxylesterase
VRVVEAGHLSNLEAPVAFAEAIRGFLAGFTSV